MPLLRRLFLYKGASLALAFAAHAQPIDYQQPSYPSSSGLTNVPSDASKDTCPTREVLAQSKFGISCQTSQQEFFDRLVDACFAGRPKSNQACGVIIYVIDPSISFDFRKEKKLPLTMAVQLAGVLVPNGDTSKILVTVVRSNGSAANLVGDQVDDLLAPIRIDERVLLYRESGAGTRSDQKVSLLGAEVRYFPALFVSFDDAPEAMDSKAIKAHFTLQQHIVNDVQTALDDMQRLFLQGDGSAGPR